MTVDRTFVGADAQPFLDRHDVTGDDAAALLFDRHRALAVLTREGDSFVRLAAGTVAWLAGVVGGAGLAFGLWSGAPAWQRVAAPIGGLVVATAAVALGLRVWRAGREVVDAFCWWTLLPERLPEGGAGVEGWRSSPVRDAVQARVFLFRGWRPLRLLLSVVAVLSPLAFIMLALEGGPRYTPTWQDGQGPAVTVFVMALAVAGSAAGIVAFGGLFRMNRAQAQRDPVQRRLLQRDR
jgi:hypothetical protein